MWVTLDNEPHSKNDLVTLKNIDLAIEADRVKEDYVPHMFLLLHLSRTSDLYLQPVYMTKKRLASQTYGLTGEVDFSHCLHEG